MPPLHARDPVSAQDEFEELDDGDAKVRAHASGLKATVKPTPGSPLETALMEKPISTALGLQALEGAGERGLQEMLRGGAQRRPDVTPDTSVAATPATDATAVAQASSAGAGSDGPLELAPKTGPRRYWLFGPREDA